MKKYVVFLLLGIGMLGCKKDVVEEPPALSFLQIEAAKNKGKIEYNAEVTIENDTVKILVPSMGFDKKFIATFNAENATVTVNDTIQQSGVTLTDFSKPVTYKLTSEKGTTKSYTVILKNFTGIPILYLNTTDSITSKEVYVNGSLIINTNGLYEQTKNNITLQAKGRGNSTWDIHPKKPYRLKFTEKAAMLGMPTAKNWVLLANYSDKTLMRTSICFDLGMKLGADFTPQGRFVELVMNNKYAGSYYLTSQVEVNENRVNIKELKPSNTSATDITGGYLLEEDRRLGEPNWFFTKKNLPFNIKSPDNITPDQLDYIHNYIQETEDVIFSDDFADPDKGYQKYINTESFINWFIVQELMKNEDAKDFSSNYYYKERGGKLGMGPLWDFDLAAGNNNYSDSRYPTGWWVKEGPWFNRLFEDPNFRAKVKKRWNEVKGNDVYKIAANIDKTATYLKYSQTRNFTRWPILDQYVWPNQFVLGSYDKEVAQFKKWLAERTTWMDSEINKF